MSESEFWKATPRKVLALLDAKNRIEGNGKQSAKKAKYIDQIPGL